MLIVLHWPQPEISQQLVLT